MSWTTNAPPTVSTHRSPLPDQDQRPLPLDKATKRMSAYDIHIHPRRLWLPLERTIPAAGRITGAENAHTPAVKDIQLLQLHIPPALDAKTIIMPISIWRKGI